MIGREGRPVLSFERQPQLWFHTGSSEKWLQARLLSDKYGLVVRQSSQERTKVEDYSLGPEEMIEASLREAVDRTGGRALVFVEDTTVRIEALSSETVDVPGLATKEWFAETAFEDLQDSIDRAGGDRRASVRSEIALFVPKLDRTVRFREVTHGTIVARRPPDWTHPLYPWLTTATFNGWFIPDGSSKALGLMEPEESERYDFRARAYRALFDRVQEYTAAINLPAHGYRITASVRAPRSEQLRLFEKDPRLLVIGRTCAGKSTFAEYANTSHGILHIEASAQLREMQPPAGADLPNPVKESAAYAKALLEISGRAAVAEHILEHKGGELADRPFVVSGLRTLEEVELLLRKLHGITIVLIEAPANQRWQRSLQRPRPGRPMMDRQQFRRADREQDDFGLLPVARDIADVVIANREDLSTYLSSVEQCLSNMRDPQFVPKGARPKSTRLSRALQCLVDNGPMTLPQIEDAAGLGDHNVSRFFGAAPLTVTHEGPSTGPYLWNITEAGYAYLRILDS